MTDELESGSKVKYHTGDGKWKNGTVHAVRKIEDNKTHEVITTSYLVDTGRNTRVDVYTTNLKHLAYGQEFSKHTDRGASTEVAVAKAKAHVEKMPDEIVEETVRQPQQVEVAQENIKPR